MDSLSAMAGASSGSADGNTKMFSGENEDGKEYRRWKTWVINKLLTLDGKVSAKARGAYVYTLLQGKALECVEHLDPSEYHVEGGETKLLKLLDDRFPQKETLDEMSEVLTEVFSLKANDGETLKVWISRATECFDRCSRKCDVAFPEEAKGWLILHRSGLSEEQKAIVLARSGGAMKREAVGRAMRSCYPEYVVSKRKTLVAGLIEADAAENDEADSDPILQEVEAFLAEHDSLIPAEEPDGRRNARSSVRCSAPAVLTLRKIFGSRTVWRSKSSKRRHVATSVIKSDIGPVNAGLARVKDVDLALQSQLIQVQLWWNPSVKILLLL